MSYRVLIADSDPIHKDLTRDIVAEERPDTQVVTVRSARDAVKLLTSQSWDLIITDWHLPDMDGLQLLELVQSATPNLPAILTATVDLGEIRERNRHRRASFVAFSKPFSIPAFLEQIDSLLIQTDSSAPNSNKSGIMHKHTPSAVRPKKRFVPALG
jgi:CheY-like chemotaxis protein